MTSFRCDKCGLSACYKRYSKLRICDDRSSLHAMGETYPEIKEVLHLDCTKCNDDFVAIRFPVKGQEIFMVGRYDNGFVIKDPEGKEHFVDVISQKEASHAAEKKCDLKAWHAYCHDCVLREWGYLDFFAAAKVEVESQEEDSVVAVEKDEEVGMWQLMQSCDPTKFCIANGCYREKGSSQLCDKHLRRLSAKNGVEPLLEFYRSKGYKVEKSEEKGKNTAVYLNGDVVKCVAYDDKSLLKDKENIIAYFKAAGFSTCQYPITRGILKGQLCGKKVWDDGRYCQGCGKKKSVNQNL